MSDIEKLVLPFLFGILAGVVIALLTFPSPLDKAISIERQCLLYDEFTVNNTEFHCSRKANK